MVLNETDLQLTRGKVATNEFAASRNRMRRHHCVDCGVALWFSSPDYSGIIAVKPGTLDDTSTLRPIAHMWVRSAQPWLDIGNDIPVFEEQPSFAELLEIAQQDGDE